MRLHDYLSGWKHLLIDAQEVTLGMNGEVAELYQEFVQNHYLDILLKVYTRLDECFACPWEQWRDGYYRHYPPYAWELNHLAKHFPDYLEQHRLLEAGLVELARYEWAEYAVSTQWFPQEVGMGWGRGELCRLNPAHQLLEFRFDVGQWVFHWERENGQTPLQGRPRPCPNVLVVARDTKTHGCVMTQCDLLDLIIYQVLSDRAQSEGELLVSCLDASRNTEFQFTEQQFQEKMGFLKGQSILIQE